MGLEEFKDTPKKTMDSNANRSSSFSRLIKFSLPRLVCFPKNCQSGSKCIKLRLKFQFLFLTVSVSENLYRKRCTTLNIMMRPKKRGIKYIYNKELVSHPLCCCLRLKSTQISELSQKSCTNSYKDLNGAGWVAFEFCSQYP